MNPMWMAILDGVANDLANEDFVLDVGFTPYGEPCASTYIRDRINPRIEILRSRTLHEDSPGPSAEKTPPGYK